MSTYKREVTEDDWARFGLNKAGNASDRGGVDSEVAQDEQQKGFNDNVADDDDLFAEEQKSTQSKPWWKANFFVTEPILFGTWDGVFTSVIINIFGVVVFLKTGWMVGNAGINESVLILFLCCALALIPVLSAIGICERCQIQSGGVYFLVSHVLGARIGGSIGMLYSFGQSVATALVAVGFGWSMASLFDSTNVWAVRFIAIFAIVALLAINIAGVKWVIKLQLLLLGILLLSCADFAIGSFVPKYDNFEVGVVGYSAETFRNNTEALYPGGHENFFSVFGVYFATFTGVLAGVNMSGDLKNPTKNIPAGELAALGTSGIMCLIFLLILGGVCDRTSLLNDTMIAEKVSWIKILFLAGVYISSLSSILGSLYGAPRVLQTMASENTIPFMKPLEAGRGPNKVPILATLVVVIVAIIFVFIGDMNTLAVLSTLPFLITYAFINYAYVSLAMTFDLQQQRQASEQAVDSTGIKPSYGSMNKVADGLANTEEDLSKLFPERNPQIPGENQAQAAATEGVAPGAAPSKTKTKPHRKDNPALPDTSASQNLITSHNSFELDLNESDSESEDLGPSIITQPKSFYSRFCNRYVALIGSAVNLIIIFFIHWGYAFMNVLLLFVVYFYVGLANPGVFPGISEFSIPHSIRVVFNKLRGKSNDDAVIVSKLHPSVETLTSRLNEENVDYPNRQYHKSKTEPMNYEFD